MHTIYQLLAAQPSIKLPFQSFIELVAKYSAAAFLSPPLTVRASNTASCVYPISFSSWTSLSSKAPNCFSLSSVVFFISPSLKNGTDNSPYLMWSLLATKSMQHWCLLRLSSPKRRSTLLSSKTVKLH